jgi:hypothetical protein
MMQESSSSTSTAAHAQQRGVKVMHNAGNHVATWGLGLPCELCKQLYGRDQTQGGGLHAIRFDKARHKLPPACLSYCD